MAVVLKLKLDADVHRLLLEPSKLNFEGLREAIQVVYPFMEFTAKYLDEENELCTLCETTFTDFLAHAVEQKGKKTLKLELFKTEVPTENARPMPVPAVEGHSTEQNPAGNLMQLGTRMVQAFLQKGLGKGFRDKWHHGPHALKPLKFAVMQMHRQGVLNSKSMAALVLGGMPDAMSLLALHPDKVDWKLTDKMSDLQPFLKQLRDLCTSTPGVEQCAVELTKWIQNETTASAALLHLLPAVDALPFEPRVAFLEAIYSRLEGHLQTKLKEVREEHPWIPDVPMVHGGVTCDGCNKGPIHGLRFKCKDCPDCDLCAECFTNKASVHDGICAKHNFEMMTFPCPTGDWMQMCKGKGKGKFKGNGKGKCWDSSKDETVNFIEGTQYSQGHWKQMCNGKGKGKCKGKGKGKGWDCTGKPSSEETVDNSHAQVSRPCAREGCRYASTWHRTHCCGKCAVVGEHGSRCASKVFVSTLGAGADTATDKNCTDDCTEPIAQHATGHFNMVFPVELEDGRRLTIAWNKGEVPKEVADKFALAHGIASDELPTVEAFVMQAHAAVEAQRAQHGNDEKTHPARESTSVEDALIGASSSKVENEEQQDPKAEDAAPAQKVVLSVEAVAPAQMPRVCAHEGCNFAVTWHPTHCCAMCALKGEHGGRCERKLFARQPAMETEVVKDKGCSENFLQDSKVEDVAPQVQQEPKDEDEAPAKTHQDPDHEMKQIAQHLEEMGLGSADVLLELLKSNGGSVHSVLEVLLSGDMA